MVARGTDGVYRTQPIETPSNGDCALPVVATDIMDAEGSARWNAWWDQRFAVENEAWCRTVAEATMTLIHEHVAPLERRIKDLELKLAEARGAIDVLRTVGSGGLNFRGPYDDGQSYARNDVAMKDGSSFVALRDHPGSLPGDGWRLMASAGKRGARGIQGPRGAPVKVKWATFDSAKMAIGLIMSDGTSATLPLRGVFRGVTIDRENYCIVVRMSDNSEFRFSVRELFQQYDDEKQGR
jgi:hypothetical protein